MEEVVLGFLEGVVDLRTCHLLLRVARGMAITSLWRFFVVDAGGCK